MDISIVFQIVTALTLGHSSLPTVLIPALDIKAVISSLTDLRLPPIGVLWWYIIYHLIKIF